MILLDASTKQLQAFASLVLPLVDDNADMVGAMDNADICEVLRPIVVSTDAVVSPHLGTASSQIWFLRLCVQFPKHV